jgi:hypothetical protein
MAIRQASAGGPAAGGKDSFCAPAKAGTAVGAVTGLVVWLLVAFIPAFHNGVPEPVVAVLPVALGWLGHTFTTWRVAHPVVAVPAVPASPVAEGGGAQAGVTGLAVTGVPQ